ncbi:MAG: formimidoylglutamase [Candidatus Obscuribacterales bacterium]|nr:formimidoylglutamase [Candidatus Obscuribacterales bacterium]
MTEAFQISICTKSALAATSVRRGETKLGEEIKLLNNAEPGKLPQALADSVASGARYALIGVPEDIGPRANLGRGGAEKAWAAFLQFFVNMQANQFFDSSKILLVGAVDLTSIHEQEKQMTGVDGKVSTTDLRQLCAQIDDLVHPIVRECVTAGLEPIVIGGGNNNSYPTIKGVVTALRKRHNDDSLSLATVNCDPHADFRLIEGRHSGNPFTFADRDGFLKAYCVLGAHENFNSRDMIDRMAERSYPLFFWDQSVRGEKTWEQQVASVIDYLSKSKMISGIELDLDGIKNFPASAKTPFGITEEQAFYFIHKVASALDSKYLHISEAAPQYAEDGERMVGKVIAKTVIEYVCAREKYGSAKLAQSLAVLARV